MGPSKRYPVGRLTNVPDHLFQYARGLFEGLVDRIRQDTDVPEEEARELAAMMMSVEAAPVLGRLPCSEDRENYDRAGSE